MLFFTNKNLIKRKWEEFSHDIVDFQEAYIVEGFTVGELYKTEYFTC